MSDQAKKKRTITVQEYLSLGYIYLLLLGIVNDAIYYGFLGINVLDYASILDVLISPVSLLTGNIILPAVFLGVWIFGYFYFKYVIPRLIKKEAEKKKKNIEEEVKKGMKIESFIVFMSFMLLCMFVGIGIGMGGKRKEQLEAGELKMNHIIHFQDNRELRVKVLGQNSTYIFYVPENGKEVMISPIMSNITWIKKLKKTLDE